MPQPDETPSGATFVQPADQAMSEAPRIGPAWPAGGPVVRHPDQVTAEWTFGATSDDAVRRLVRGADHDRPAASAGALVIGCGALARELLAVAERIPGLRIACLAPDLHNRPEGIPAAVRRRIHAARRDGYERIFVAYADCGTGGLLDPVLADEGVERLPGAHCYEVFAGSGTFAAMADAEPGTFWLTDFLARNFERLVIRGLGMDRHPELQVVYFAHYHRVVYLSQTDDPDLLAMARRAAERLGLAFEHRPTGVLNLAAPIEAWAASAAPAATDGAAAPDSRGAGVSDEITPQRGVLGPTSARSARGPRTSSTFGPNRARYARGTGSRTRIRTAD